MMQHNTLGSNICNFGEQWSPWHSKEGDAQDDQNGAHRDCGKNDRWIWNNQQVRSIMDITSNTRLAVISQATS